MKRQTPPFAVQIELTEGCNLRCPFCGLQGIRSKEEQGKNYKYMTSSTLEKLILSMLEHEWNPRIEFAMHGEPSMHPEYTSMIMIAREIAPRYQIMMTSNGGGLLKKPGPTDNIRALFDVGLNILALDDYNGIKIVPRIREMVINRKDIFTDIAIFDYPNQPEGNPHRRHPIKYMMLTFVQDITLAHKGTHAVLNNHAGSGAPPLKEPLQERCAKPFRELSVRWDGSIAICCNDWRGEYKCGNINDTDIDSIWNGAAFTAARQILYQGNRKDIKPCSVCDNHSYRNGLLPDKHGKVELTKPNAGTYLAIEQAQQGKSYTEARRTEWGF
jgi:radical SAM protein with 4Fe4S-binding SPASM domain